MTVNQTAQELPLVFRIQDWRMAPKLLAAFLAMVIIPLGIYSLISVPQTRDTLLAQGATNLIATSNSTATAIDRYLSDKREDIISISGLPEISAFVANPQDATARANALKALKAANNRVYYDSVAIVNTDGKIILSSAPDDINTDIKFRPYFIEAMKGKPYVSDPSVSVITNQPAIFFSMAVFDPAANIIGVVHSRLSLYGIWDLVEQDKNAVGAGTYGLLLDDNGIRLASSLSLGNRETVAGALLYTAMMPVQPDVEKMLVAEKRFGNAMASNIRVLPLPEVANAFVTPSTKTFETSADDSSERHYAAISALNVKPWRYVLMTPLTTFTATADTLRTISFLIVIIVGALAIILAVILAREITRPIIQLTNVADRISLGELDAKIEINRKDEIGELAEAVSRMQASLQAAIERLRARRTNPS